MPQLAPVSLVAPGSKGLNKEREFSLLPPVWATEAINCVVTGGDRIGAREGWASVTTTPITGTPEIAVVHEYLEKDGTVTVISAADNKIYKDVDDFTDAANDITSSTAPTADNWQFVNFNGKVIGFQKNHNSIEWSGTGDFTDQSLTTTGQPGTFDAGNCALAAFGRVWVADADLQTIRYSALLDDTDYSTANGGGSIDMSSVWTQGMDRIVAIAALGSNLIVFGRNHIIIWADDSGSEIGLNPNNLYVADTIEGTGCIARDSVQAIGEGDLWYLSRHGVQSLKRVIQDKNNPLVSVTKSIREQLQAYIKNERGTDDEMVRTRSVHYSEDNMYLLLLPDTDRIIYINTGRPFRDEEDDIIYPVTEWVMGGTPRSFCAREDGTLLIGFSGELGRYGNANVYRDNGDSYSMSFWTGWLDLGQDLNNRLKMIKEISTIVQIGGSGSVSWRWEFDFDGTPVSKTVNYVGAAQAEYGEAEFNVDDYAGALSISHKRFPGRGQGQYIRVGVSLAVDGFGFVIQQLQIVPAIGRVIP